MNRQYIYDKGFLNGMVAMSMTGLFFTIVINITHQRLGAGYIVFGIPILVKLVLWFRELIIGDIQ